MTQAKADPVKRRRKKTKNRLAATDYAAPVSAVLYRLGGCTLEQAGRWLHLCLPEHFAREESAYEAARRTLQIMREQGQVEVVSIRRTRRPDLFSETSVRLNANTVVSLVLRCVDRDPSAGEFRRDRKNADAPGAIPRGSAGAGTVERAIR